MNQKQIFELMEKFDESKLSVLKVESEGFKITLKSDSAPAHRPAEYTGLYQSYL